MKAMVFLGGGRITGALAAGLRLAGYDGEIVVYDRNPEKVRALRRESRVEMARDLKSAVASRGRDADCCGAAGVGARRLLEEIAACGVAAPKLCVSLAAGIPLRKLRGLWVTGGAVGAGDAESGVPRWHGIDCGEL